MKSDVLFIGNFLSKTRGTVGPTELMAKRYKEEGRTIIMASTCHSRILRLFDMCLKSCLCRYRTISIDVYSTKALFFASVTSLIAFVRKKDIVLILHGGGLVDVYGQNPSKIKRLFNRATHIVAPSHFIKQFFERKGFNVEYIPNTINHDIFSFRESRKNDHSILWVRAFSEIYRPELAIMALYYLSLKFPDVSLTMVGPDKGILSKSKLLIKDLKLEDRVSIVGKVENKNLPSFFYSHQVYLNTTKLESFGMALLEAAACGSPIVSTSVGEIPLIWTNNKNILLSELNDAAEISALIEKLFIDHDLYCSIQRNAFENARQFAWDKVCVKWERILKF